MARTTPFRESDRNAYWYVGDLDPHRPMRRGCSRDRWIGIVNGLLTRDAEGHLVYRAASLFHDGELHVIRVGTPEWNTFLRDFIYASGYRMCWEPKPKRDRRPEPSLFANNEAA